MEVVKKRKISLDWEKLLPCEDDDAPHELEIVRNENQKDDVKQIPDHELNASILRQKQLFESRGSKLPDKGAKLQHNIKRLEDERERRKLLRLQKDAHECKQLTQSKSLSLNDPSNGFTSPQDHVQSAFASYFVRKMEEKSDNGAGKAFDKELAVLGCCSHQNVKRNKKFLRKESHRDRLSFRQSPFQSPGSHRLNNRLQDGDRRGSASSMHSLRPMEENFSGCFSKNNASEVQPSIHSSATKGQTFVLVDEEDYQPTVSTQLEDKLPGWIKETKIYFPSRNDPEAVELCYSDIKCLAPETYLSSTIMNFYIQYLQQQGSLTEGARGSYHFFNTYFYQKLKEAVSRKSDKETFFVKFRRWWKGVNIFEKAYIFLPIHEDLHWSLVIICIPDKEDESGPIILHLDSLGYHTSCQIFENIKRYIREEWNYLNQEVASLNIPIAERIWKYLPRRIDEKRIMVPQQKNDYDCGLFVLFFMERFIEEAPGRLRKEDLAMFGRQWFKPEEASALRERIRILILEQFQNGSAEDLSRESSPAPSANASDENTKP